MKKLIQFAATMLVVTGLAMPVSLLAQDKDAKLIDDNKEARPASLNRIASCNSLFDNSVDM
jgi:hypothetical protein